MKKVVVVLFLFFGSVFNYLGDIKVDLHLKLETTGMKEAKEKVLKSAGNAVKAGVKVVKEKFIENNQKKRRKLFTKSDVDKEIRKQFEKLKKTPPGATASIRGIKRKIAILKMMREATED